MAEQEPKTTPVRISKNAAANERSVHHAVFEKLQQRISLGEWLPGERMPSISQLAKEFQVGSGSIREALRSLQSINLVKIEHGSGVYVTGKHPSTELSRHFQNMGAGLRFALAETRRVLEPELAAMAAERGSDEELLEIEKLVEKMDQAARNGGDFADLDVQFHRLIAHAARNPILYQTMEGVSDLFLESRRTILLDPIALMRALRYHALIADALRSRNAAQSRLLMQGHMNSMVDEILASEEYKEALKIQNQDQQEKI
jgi:GntR family transcriptional repressor for pyruvate dehydrogenase complex